MDTVDASDDAMIVAQLKRWEEATERSRRRKGQLAKDHPPADSLVITFMLSRLSGAANGPPGPGRHMFATSQLPLPYPPCIRPTDQLRPIAISEMRLETHHRGRMTVVRARTPPNRMTAVMAIVEDEEGTALLLQLYYQLDEDLIPASSILDEGKCYVIKEPFFKCATNGGYSLRVDHLSDIVHVDDSDELVPLKWRSARQLPRHTSEYYRAKGNEAVKAKMWAEAQHLYSSAVVAASDSEARRPALLNRSLANLRLGFHELALDDARQSMGLGSEPSEKGLFREARALYELTRFSESLETLQELARMFPGNAEVTNVEIPRTQARIEEQRTGKYNFRRMYKQAKQTPPLIDCATFTGPVAVRTSPCRGKGLFTTSKVVAGQLLLCEKAFAYTYVGDDPEGSRTTFLINMETKTASMGGQATLLTQLMHKLYNNRDALRAYTDLHRGDYVAPAGEEVDGHAIVDSFLVDRVRALNSFGAPRTSLNTFTQGHSEHSKAGGHKTCGIWLTASRINHSCLGNCRRSFIGDMQIIRASTDMEANTELLFSYRLPERMDSYDEAQKKLSSWGFKCDCKLCEIRKATPKAALTERKKLCSELKLFLGRSHSSSAANISRLKALMTKIDQTYSSAGKDGSRWDIWDAYFAAGNYLTDAAKFEDAVRMFVKSLECLGFTVAAKVSPRPATFEVVKWGSLVTPLIFQHLQMVYKKVFKADGALVARLERYTAVAYSIIIGEHETMAGTELKLLI